jgi:predicted MFS family arabinose efflux permease
MHCPRLWKATVKKAALSCVQANASKPARQEACGVILAGIDMANFHGLPIAAVL